MSKPVKNAPRTAPRPDPRETSRRFSRSGGWLVMLAILELVWLGRYLIQPLPNAQGPRGVAISRGLIMFSALPEVVPGTTFRGSLLGRGLEELSHWENLPQRLPILAAGGLIVAAALGVGRAILRTLRLEDMRPLERTALAFGLGTAMLGVLAMLVGRLGWLSPWTFRLGLATIAVLGFAASSRRRKDAPILEKEVSGRGLRPSDLVPWLVAAPFLVALVLGSMLPAIDFDVIEYHLQGPKEYYQAGRILFLPHNVYTTMPFNVEMLHLMGMEVMGDWWWGGLAGQLLVALYAPLTAVLIAGATTRLGSPKGAWFTPIIYLSTPWVYRMGVISYVEGPLCFYHAALIWGLVHLREAATGTLARNWLLMGLLAGAAMACKYPALISAVIPFGLVAAHDARRSRSARPLIAFAIGCSIVIGPWLVKNVFETGNPVYPLAYRVFGGSPWDEARERQWSSAHGPREVTFPALWNALVDVTGRSDWQSPFYLAFCPLAILRPGTIRRAKLLGSYAAYLFLTWWLLTHRLDRFWLPMLPVLAILAGLGADWSERTGWSVLRASILVFGLVVNLTYCSTALCGLNEWTGDLEVLRRDLPKRLNRPLITTDIELPPGAKILLVGQAAVFHVQHPVLYNTVFDPEIIEVLSRDRSPREFRETLRERGVTHVYVDWKEIKRHRKPGGYGFSAYVTPQLFENWVAAGILGPPSQAGQEQELYEVR